jgi:hypothetical protein
MGGFGVDGVCCGVVCYGMVRRGVVCCGAVWCCPLLFSFAYRFSHFLPGASLPMSAGAVPSGSPPASAPPSPPESPPIPADGSDGPVDFGDEPPEPLSAGDGSAHVSPGCSALTLLNSIREFLLSGGLGSQLRPVGPPPASLPPSPPVPDDGSDGPPDLVLPASVPVVQVSVPPLRDHAPSSVVAR